MHNSDSLESIRLLDGLFNDYMSAFTIASGFLEDCTVASVVEVVGFDGSAGFDEEVVVDDLLYSIDSSCIFHHPALFLEEEDLFDPLLLDLGVIDCSQISVFLCSSSFIEPDFVRSSSSDCRLARSLLSENCTFNDVEFSSTFSTGMTEDGQANCSSLGCCLLIPSGLDDSHFNDLVNDDVNQMGDASLVMVVGSVDPIISDFVVKESPSSDYGSGLWSVDPVEQCLSPFVTRNSLEVLNCLNIVVNCVKDNDRQLVVHDDLAVDCVNDAPSSFGCSDAPLTMDMFDSDFYGCSCESGDCACFFFDRDDVVLLYHFEHGVLDLNKFVLVNALSSEPAALLGSESSVDGFCSAVMVDSCKAESASVSMPSIKRNDVACLAFDAECSDVSMLSYERNVDDCLSIDAECSDVSLLSVERNVVVCLSTDVEYFDDSLLSIKRNVDANLENDAMCSEVSMPSIQNNVDTCLAFVAKCSDDSRVTFERNDVVTECSKSSMFVEGSDYTDSSVCVSDDAQVADQVFVGTCGRAWVIHDVGLLAVGEGLTSDKAVWSKDVGYLVSEQAASSSILSSDLLDSVYATPLAGPKKCRKGKKWLVSSGVVRRSARLNSSRVRLSHVDSEVVILDSSANVGTSGSGSDCGFS